MSCTSCSRGAAAAAANFCKASGLFTSLGIDLAFCRRINFSVALL